MKMRLLVTVIITVLCGQVSAQVEKIVPNKYWQYDHSHYDNNKRTVYTFKSIPLDSLKEVALYFEPGGAFKEVTTKDHPKPARNGTWEVKGQTLILHFPNKTWNYNISFMNNKEFQCTMN